MVKIRLTRMGSKGKPFYRIVVTSARKQRDGKYIELVGTYNPKLGEIKINKEIALKWLQLGAQMTPTIKNIFSHEGILVEFANLKTKGNLKSNSKSGSRFGKEFDLSKGYMEPGTKINKEEKSLKEKAVEDVKTEDDSVKVVETKEKVEAKDDSDKAKTVETKEKTEAKDDSDKAKTVEAKDTKEKK